MKRLAFCLIGLLSLVLSSRIAAEDEKFTSEQLALRSEIMQFLKEEGFMPEIDTDDDIKFKSEGRNYYVTVSKTDKNPLYVTLYIPYTYPSDYTSDDVIRATKSLNKYKGVKVVCFESSYRISSELYLRDADLFKESFYKVKSQIDNVRGDFLEECETAASTGASGSASISEIPFIITKMEVANVEEDGTIIQNYGSTIYDYKTKYLKPRITIKPFKTSGSVKLYIKMFGNNNLKTGSSSPEGYSYTDTITISGSSSQTFNLSGWGSNTSGHWSAGTYRFEVWYGDYCLGSKTFKVI